MCWRRPSSLRRKTSTIWNEDALQSRCPFWVKTGSAYADPAFPFYPQQQTPVCRSLRSVFVPNSEVDGFTQHHIGAAMLVAQQRRASRAVHQAPLSQAWLVARLGAAATAARVKVAASVKRIIRAGSRQWRHLRGGIAMMAGRRTGKDHGVGLGSVGHQSRTFPSRSRQRRFAY
jgi:hypothetical protein